MIILRSGEFLRSLRLRGCDLSGVSKPVTRPIRVGRSIGVVPWSIHLLRRHLERFDQVGGRLMEPHLSSYDVACFHSESTRDESKDWMFRYSILFS